MINTKYVIRKEELMDWLTREDVNKVVIRKPEYTALKNPYICRVEVYHTLANKKFLLKLERTLQKFLNKNKKSETPFSNREVSHLYIKSSLAIESISRSQLKKIIDFEAAHNLDFNIPDEIKKFIKNYNEIQYK